MKFFRIFLIAFILMISACAPKADYDIRDTWDYTLTDLEGNTYDAGLITFSGAPAKGTHLEINIYQVEYEGTYTVKGSTVEVVIDANETWQGTVTGENTMSGTWQGAQGASGTWTAARQP